MGAKTIMKQFKACLLVGLSLAGCAVRHPSKPTADLGKFYFGYEVQGKNSADVIQAFDNGKDTFLQFGSTVDSSKVTVRTPGSKAVLIARVVDCFLVIPGVFPEVALRLSRSKPNKNKDLKADITVIRLSKLVKS